jgi:hypothetical protein
MSGRSDGRHGTDEALAHIVGELAEMIVQHRAGIDRIEMGRNEIGDVRPVGTDADQHADRRARSNSAVAIFDREQQDGQAQRHHRREQRDNEPDPFTESHAPDGEKSEQGGRGR